MLLKLLDNVYVMVEMTRINLYLYDFYVEDLVYYEYDVSICSFTMSYVNLYLYDAYVYIISSYAYILCWLTI